jgi:hypothetical protein
MSKSANASPLKTAEGAVQDAMSKVDLAIRDKLGRVEIKRRGKVFSQAAKIYAGVVEAYE